ncbi:TraI domain-containing protein [Endozoicomonas euniceicola]|uniref:TraI domain-containing protein n=1 Tax=Endozoicomonas euniceicola TaxID=1234143 RepID=A0ABY6GUA0_9GAMM|nr:TraI domain-containing protein [Endozoicomonas euniceicola]UYM15969.1 TraI domain-containing protein [Endozoicomonas euniceicola]
MTASQVLSVVNHWLHPQQKTEPLPIPQPAPDTNPSEGCAGYQVGVGTILHQQQSLIHQVSEQLCLPDELQELFNQTLDQLALWLHLLPAHPLHHCEPAGALRHALETAFWAVSSTQQIHVDHDLYPDRRRARQPLWRLMAGVAGLLHDSGRMVSCVTIRDEQAGQWVATQQSLGSWLQQHRIERYCPHWQHCESRPDKPIPQEYTWTNLLLLEQLIPNNLRYALQSDRDKGILWQTFISALVGQSSPLAVKQLVSAVEVARLKSVKLHFVRGEALTGLNQPIAPERSTLKEAASKQPVSKDLSENGLGWLKQVVSQLNPDSVKWAKESLLLKWPEDVAGQEGLPDPDVLLECWQEQGWLRPIANQVIIRRNGRQVIALQPEISKQCRQWLPASEANAEAAP